MRQDTQASRTATNKQTVQQEMRIHQEKRKMSPLPSSMSKKSLHNDNKLKLLVYQPNLLLKSYKILVCNWK